MATEKTDAIWREMGLTDGEYDSIVDGLGRAPNYTELGVFSVLWSEHCAYKHSKPLLKSLPVEGDGVLVGPGENAGVVDVGEGLACAFKIESHNHPSAVEPYEGAATGAGGIVRDVLAMGARPVALLNSLRFGPLDDEKNKALLRGVVAGIGDYGNGLGVPTIGGEVFFAGPYAKNPLVNAMCVGILEHGHLHKGRAYGLGNLVMVTGRPTGRDGIHGCTFASDALDETSEARKSNVPKGDPAVERLLIEACLEMMEAGAVVGIQDMGAAGIASSCAETAARAGTGLRIDIDAVPKAEEDMNAYEVMLSETQERMLLVVSPEKAGAVKGIGEKWGLKVSEIGIVTDTGNLEVLEGGALAASIPVSFLTEGAPTYNPPATVPSYVLENGEWSLEEAGIEDLGKDAATDALFNLLLSPNIASRHPVFEKFDAAARGDTLLGPDSGACLLRLRDTKRALAFSTDCNGRLVFLNPRAGAAWAVAEAARNVAVTGARPIAVTNCLNFGSPEKPEIFWQIKEAVAGMAEACRALGTPVTGGNVSLYNETEGDTVYPTPVIGMVGVLENLERRVSPGFKRVGDTIVLLGKVWGDERSLHGSEYLEQAHGVVKGNPRHPDLDLEKGLVEVLVDAAARNLLRSAQDLSEGGLAVALAECCMYGEPGSKGAAVSIGGLIAPEKAGARLDSVLFGEGNSAVIASVEPGAEKALMDLCAYHGVPAQVLGEVIAQNFLVETGDRDLIVTALGSQMKDAWFGGLRRALGETQ